MTRPRTDGGFHGSSRLRFVASSLLSSEFVGIFSLFSLSLFLSTAKVLESTTTGTISQRLRATEKRVGCAFMRSKEASVSNSRESKEMKKKKKKD